LEFERLEQKEKKGRGDLGKKNYKKNLLAFEKTRKLEKKFIFWNFTKK
jgi:hypothetical protein